MAQKTPYFLTLEREKQCKALEAVIFASDDPITQKDLFRFLILEDFNQSQVNDGNGENTEQKDELWGTFTPEYFDELVAEINKDLDFSSRPFRIVNIGGGFQFATTPQYGEYVHRLLKSKSRKRLSQAALETLAIIAYKQPTTRAEIDSIRGVNSGEVVNALLEKNLVVISGRAETIGKPLLYSTSDEFLRVFGINKISDLPKLREIDELMEQNPQGALIAAMEEMNKEAASPENEESQSGAESESEVISSSSEDSDTTLIEESESNIEIEITSETTEDVIDEDVIDEDVIDEDVIDEDVIDEDVIDEDVIDEDVIDEDVIDEDVIDEDAIDEDVIDEDVIDEDVIDEDVIDEDVIDEEESMTASENGNENSDENVGSIEVVNVEDAEEVLTEKVQESDDVKVENEGQSL